MTVPKSQPAARLATRLAFVAAGAVVGAWAPLVPFAKARVGVDASQLGLLLLCIGVGSLMAMPVTGLVAARRGSRSMILLGGVGAGLLLPVLAAAATPAVLGVTLLLFGASLGTLDVAMNAHAVEVEAAAERPLMSGFHALFSIGGLAGAGGVTLLLSLGASPFAATLAMAAAVLAAVAVAAPRLLRTSGGHAGVSFVAPRGVVILLAILAVLAFLTEGAVLDWGALLITERGLAGREQAGLGFMFFSVAMSGGRLLGDRLVAGLGGKRVLQLSGALAVAGLAMVLSTHVAALALAGFALVGLGASNIVPILFSAAGRQQIMPPPLAVAAVTTIGYAGVLAGPALIGFVAQAASLTTAFWLLMVALAAAPLTAGAVVRGADD
jgi:predicted MFS family arabinose efflux permease